MVHKQAQPYEYREEIAMEEKKGREGNCALTLERDKIDLIYTWQTEKYNLYW